MNKSFVIFEQIWDDDQLLELKVTVSNGQFSGSTNVYSTARALNDFSSGIDRFPCSPSACYTFNSGDDGLMRSVTLEFSTHASTGHVSVAFTLQNGRDIVRSALTVEPAAIDRFHIALLALSQGVSNRAELEGL